MKKKTQQDNKKLKIMIGILIALSIYAIYHFFFRLPNVTGPLLESESGVELSTIPGNDLIVILQRLESIEIDTKLFEREDFLAMTDYSTDLIPEPTGRIDPLLPIGF